MDSFWPILLGAIILIGLSILGLGIGTLITGKVKLRRGCGYRPGSKKSCSLCGKEKECDEKEKNDNSSDK